MTKKKLFQILLPLYSKEGEPIPVENYKELKVELTEHFGGLTSYSRSPATGVWKDPKDEIAVDTIIVYEIVSDSREVNYWQNLKVALEKKFDQDEIMIRCQTIETV